MKTHNEELFELEERFWQSLVDEDADTATSLLTEPALMVSPMGVMKFDHDRYREMAENGSMVLENYKLSDMDVTFPSDDVAVITYKVKQTLGTRGKPEKTTQEMADSSVWVRSNGSWLCAMHTETPVTH
jgi:hypothetical protein